MHVKVISRQSFLMLTVVESTRQVLTAVLCVHGQDQGQAQKKKKSFNVECYLTAQDLILTNFG